MRVLCLCLALLLVFPAAAQRPEWRTAFEYDVLMRPHAYEPEEIRLRAGEPVKLRFINQGQATYSFSAEEFFEAATIRESDTEYVVNGEVRLAPGERRVIALVPAAGRYRVRSGNLLHHLLGMKGSIIVE